MFLVSDTLNKRKKRINDLLKNGESALAVLLSAAHLEWVLSRAIISLGVSPNRDIHKSLSKCHGLDRYRELWRDEVLPGRNNVDVLSNEIKRWSQLKKHYELRHVLIHGRESCTMKFAKPCIQTILSAADDVYVLLKSVNIDIHKRLKIRKKRRKY